MNERDLIRHFFGGFVRLHILYHAGESPICGMEMMQELGRHGYRLSPGTIYPILHQLEAAGWLACEVQVVSGKRRKNYRITERGRNLLAQARGRLRELFAEVVEERDRKAASAKGRQHSAGLRVRRGARCERRH